jgi:hypothetical protein
VTLAAALSGSQYAFGYVSKTAHAVNRVVHRHTSARPRTAESLAVQQKAAASLAAPGTVLDRYAEAVLASSPAAYWRLGEYSGTFADATGHAHTGTLTSGVDGYTIRADSLCRDFFDTDGCFKLAKPPQGSVQGGTQNPKTISVPFAEVFRFTSRRTFSYEAWVKIPAFTFTGKPGTDRAGIVGLYGEDQSGSQDMGTSLLATLANHRVHVVRDEGFGAGFSDLSVQIPTDEWMHAVGTYDGTVLKLFVNGELVSSADSTFSAGGASNLTIGMHSFDIGISEYNGWFYGSIDEVAVYSRALPANEVLAHYQSGLKCRHRPRAQRWNEAAGAQIARCGVVGIGS